MLKLIRPCVILDEAHKAYGQDESTKEFVKSMNRLNPRFVLELSATPKLGVSNILVNIGGQELKKEEMIKLPIEINGFTDADWKRTLAETHAKLQALEAAAAKVKRDTDRYIRPIALVRVERTGESQRDLHRVHAEDAREYLMLKLGVPESHIKVQSSERKELGQEDLLSELSEVRWIITKDALKEGWDCSFAYVLALLDRTKAGTAVTQMVGRVMRQPHARLVEGAEALNRCYIYCCVPDVAEAVKGVKKGLEREGLTGLDEFVTGGAAAEGLQTRTIERRKDFRKLKIFLPQVLHQRKGGWGAIDYDRDILGALDWNGIDASQTVDLGDASKLAMVTTTVDLHDGEALDEGGASQAIVAEAVAVDCFVRRLLDVVPNPWQAARMAQAFLSCQQADGAQLAQNRVFLSQALIHRVREQIDAEAERIFRRKLTQGEVRFHLETNEKFDYKVDNSFEVPVGRDERRLARHGSEVQRSLFDPVFESEFNSLERNFAFYLDASDAVRWWHRIAAGKEYAIQGWRRQRVYPDFLACATDDDRILVLETKGRHLAGNDDTEYKRELLATLEEAYKRAGPRGTMRIAGDPRRYLMLFEDGWEEAMNVELGSR